MIRVLVIVAGYIATGVIEGMGVSVGSLQR